MKLHPAASSARNTVTGYGTGFVTVNGRRSLSKGAHRLRLDYFQGARGTVALSLDILQGGVKSKTGGFNVPS